MIEFSVNYSVPEITVTGSYGIENATVREIIKGIDSISYLGGGK